MEIVPNTFPSLFWGYSAIWLLLCLYMFSLVRRMRRLEKASADKI